MKNNKSLIEHILIFFEYGKNERDFSDKTIENYGRYLNRFISWLKISRLTHLIPQDLSFNHVSEYKQYLSEQNIKDVTQNYYLIALRVFLSYLVEKNIPCPILSEKIKLLKIKRKESKDSLTATQLEKLLKLPDVSHNIGLRNKAILETISSTGLKIAELVSINKNNINIDPYTNRAIVEISDKRGNIRSIYISDRVTEWLIKYLDTRNDNDKALFINYKKRKTDDQSPIRLTVRSIERMVQKYGNLIDFSQPITPEILRNAYIKSVLESEPEETKTIHTQWNVIENRIKKEILWLKNNIDTLPAGYRSKDALITCEECVLRKLAILIVSGKIRVKKIKFKKLPWEYDPELYKNHIHGEEWHRKMMNVVANYFKKDGYQTSLEPIINFGRADVGAFSKSLKPPIYIEVGTTSLYKLLYNLLTMENSIFLIIPIEEHMIEFRT